jgi:hypothetical protein
MKPGYKSTELWLTVAVQVFAALLAMQPGMPWYGVVAVFGIAILKAMVYTSGRANLKSALSNNLPPSAPATPPSQGAASPTP